MPLFVLPIIYTNLPRCNHLRKNQPFRQFDFAKMNGFDDFYMSITAIISIILIKYKLLPFIPHTAPPATFYPLFL